MLTLILPVLLLVGGAQNAQPPHELSLVPADAAFQIVQSPLAAKNTFRLNRITGQVYQLVKTKEGKNLWEAIPLANDPAGPVPGKISYMLFTSALAARFTFLVNVRTGATWQLSEDTDTKELFWSRVLEPSA